MNPLTRRESVLMRVGALRSRQEATSEAAAPARNVGAASASPTPVLEIRGLEVAYLDGKRRLPAVRGVDLIVPAGRAVALVGESGSGKSTLALSVMRLIRPPVGRIEAGSIRFDGAELLDLDGRSMRQVLHEGIGYIPQDPSAALDPLCTIGRHVDETLTRSIPRVQRRGEIAELLQSLGVARAPSRMGDYPHEFSGGMNQRVVIATALAREPRLLLADEPTTALDVTTQLGILSLIDQRRKEKDLALLFVTHDLSVARRLCQDVAVMYAGRIVETGPIEAVIGAPKHPYTRALVGAIPSASAARSRMSAIPGQPPSAGDVPAGCAFAPRCPYRLDKCLEVDPALERHDNVHVACWNVGLRVRP
jgi:oligopeptide/dipeptide ABC transporter ATP-binding protein